jgi:hypothetical protein
MNKYRFFTLTKNFDINKISFRFRIPLPHIPRFWPFRIPHSTFRFLKFYFPQPWCPVIRFFIRCQIFRSAQLSVFLVPNCPFFLVPNCPVPNCPDTVCMLRFAPFFPCTISACVISSVSVFYAKVCAILSLRLYGRAPLRPAPFRSRHFVRVPRAPCRLRNFGLYPLAPSKNWL